MLLFGRYKAPEKAEAQAYAPWRSAMSKLVRNKAAMAGIIFLFIMIAGAVFAPVLTPYGMNDQSIYDRLQPPSLEHIFGTDYLGRDMLARVLYGGRVTLKIGFVSMLIAVAIGGVLGAVAGFRGGRADAVIMRVIDILTPIPGVLLAVLIMAIIGLGKSNIMYAIGIAAVPGVVRLTRSSIMEVMSSEYVEASRALGVGSFEIFFRHVLHNIASPLIIYITGGVAEAIILSTALGYVGLATTPPTAEWGYMVYLGVSYLRTEWFLAGFPCLAIVLTVLSLNMMGDGLRDAFDPRAGQNSGEVN